MARVGNRAPPGQKYALALRKISLAWRSSRFSSSRALRLVAISRRAADLSRYRSGAHPPTTAMQSVAVKVTAFTPAGGHKVFRERRAAQTPFARGHALSSGRPRCRRPIEACASSTLSQPFRQYRDIIGNAAEVFQILIVARNMQNLPAR